ncbi:MAG: hypothetical protein LBG49_02280 [Mycoplasmataceae bacterium]|jgi:hypothetical protein|nr:hypothetical protein [Mycoplasmataceae bacterium]
MKENKEYEITKSSRRDWIGVTFQCHIINKGVNVAPKWFRDFATKQEEFNKYVGGFIRKQEGFNNQQTEFNKHVNDFIQQQLEFNKQQTKFNNRVNDFMEQQVAFNSQQTEFNKHVLDVFEKNNIE